MSQCVHQNMPFPTFNLFASIIAFFATYFAGLHALTIHNRGTWMGTTTCLMPFGIIQCSIDLLPDPLQTPLPIMIVNTLIMGKLMRQILPLAACFSDIQRPIHSLTQINFNWSSPSLWVCWQQFLNDFPLLIAQITGISLSLVTHLAYSCSV